MRDRTLQNLIDRVERKLKIVEGKNYRGLESIAYYLIKEYFKTIPDTKECDFIMLEKLYSMTIELIGYLSNNYCFFKKRFDFRQKYEIINKEIDITRKWLYEMWEKGEFEYIVSAFDKKGYKNLRVEHKCLYSLCKQFPKFNVNLITELKRELGLKEI